MEEIDEHAFLCRSLVGPRGDGFLGVGWVDLMLLGVLALLDG